MAHFHIKKKKGRNYLYVREIARVAGKPTVVSQVYIGSPQRVASLVSAGVEGHAPRVVKLKVEEFGALWLADQIDRDIDLAGIVDGVVSRGAREEGPSVGEYFLYCVWNRMCEATSKNKLSAWYEHTAVQQIRPVAIEELSSQRYWERWERVSEEAIAEIARRFFKKLWKLESPGADCLLFDTTNYYTFMASDTPSELARRGRSKDGRHHLRQIGLGLLVARDSRLPLYYCVYPGNLHDSHQFGIIMDEMFGVVCGLNQSEPRETAGLTVVIDKGMNSVGNFAWIDKHHRLHFVTSYAPYFAQELAAKALEEFESVDTAKNHAPRVDERLLAYRTTGEYWGKERTVVVTYNPVTARKQAYTMESKLERLQQELLAMRAKIEEKAPYWRNPDSIRQRYLRLCDHLHIPSDLYSLKFSRATPSRALSMSFKREGARIEQKYALFGKNIIITDHMDWTTAEIVQASLDRWQVEDRFRLSKDDNLVAMRPLRHWTDSKIRCHLFACVVAMTYLRRIELKLNAAGIPRTAEDVMEDMRHFHSVLLLKADAQKPTRQLEIPTKTQAEVLSAFKHYVDDSGVLHPKSH